MAAIAQLERRSGLARGALPSRTALWFGDLMRGYLPALTVVAALLGAFHIAAFRFESRVAFAEQRERVEFGLGVLEKALQTALSGLQLLGRWSLTTQYVNDPSPAHRELLEAALLDFATTRQHYDQIRLLDRDGTEQVRIDLTRDGPRVRPRQALQDKSRRYYVRELAALPPGRIMVSPLDLNIEHGQIEYPHKPVLRIGMPLFDAAGRRQGALVLNYLGRELLEPLADAMGRPGARSLLLNADGYWLKGPHPALEWGFMFEGGPRFADRYPADWARMIERDRGTVDGAGGRFAFATLYPLGATDRERGRFWKVVSQIPPETIAGWRDDHLRQLSAQLLLAALLLLPLAVLRAGIRARAREAERCAQAPPVGTIMQSLAEGVVALDCDGVIGYANPEAERLLAASPGRLLGTRLDRLLRCAGDCAERCSGGCAIAAAVADGAPLRLHDETFVRLDGIPLTVAYVVAPLAGAGGAVIAFHAQTKPDAASSSAG